MLAKMKSVLLLMELLKETLLVKKLQCLNMQVQQEINWLIWQKQQQKNLLKMPD